MTGKVAKDHLQRTAYLYVRQSTLRQVIENTESTRRQYALRDRALELGWREDQVEVIDCDLGESGTADREGFRHLMAEVGLGHAGIVLGLEVSRLARDNIDWHRLLEVCATTDTLILDEDGLYSPQDHNDRLLLGLKGAMSAAELHVLRSRLRGGILSQAQRGALKLPLPAGLVYDSDRNVVLDPDAEVRNSIRLVFSTFERAGSSWGVVRHFEERGLTFPLRDGRGYSPGPVQWRPLTATRVRSMLRNPRYAGAFVYGRTRQVSTPNGSRIEKLAAEDWTVLIQDVHPGYIPWEQYQRNVRTLEGNARTSLQGAAREGAALLQGIAVCGVCGRNLIALYHGGKHRSHVRYACNGGTGQHRTPRCPSMSARPVDRAIGQLLLGLVAPVTLEVALSVQAEMQARDDEIAALREQAVQRSREAAELAKRRFMEVDPGNRLVADVLESEWNRSLQALRDAEDERDRLRGQDRILLDETVRQRVLELATDFPRLWNDPATPNREKKRMIRLLIEDVTLTRHGDRAHAGVRLRGGATRELDVSLQAAEHPAKLPAALVAEIRELLHHHTDAQVADILNRRGRTGSFGQPFNTSMVAHVRFRRGFESQRQMLRKNGMLTTSEIAEQLSISHDRVRRLASKGIIRKRGASQTRFLYELPGPENPVWELVKQDRHEPGMASAIQNGMEA